jgi:von Willebrand factor type D domain
MTKETWKHSTFSWALALGVILTGIGIVVGQPQPKKGVITETQPEKNKISPVLLQQREAWRKTMVRTARPTKGCHTATFPETTWRQVPCGKAPNRPYGPGHGLRALTVGNTVDFSAQVTGNTTQGEGSFDSVAGVTSENDGGSANTFSLQLNTNRFGTNACTTFHATDPGCQGWEQFIYSNSGSAFIQYWLLPFAAAGTACPAGWAAFNWPTPQQVSCFINSANAANVPVQNISALGTMKLDGAVAGVNGNADDAVTLAIGNTLFTASGDNHFPDLTNGWKFSEFNVFGDFNSTQAVFNNGSTITVRTAVNSGQGAIPPTCSQTGFTGETNNLTLVTAPAMINDANWPSIVFTETNNNPTPVSCDDADSIGDTHLKTFDGMKYDFQASGDFVLVKAADFEVQARQASGAPTWPDAAVNKAIAVQMGRTRIGLYIEPTRLIVDGHSENLADGKSILLPDGVQITRHNGVQYEISSTNGDNVHAVLNTTWIDVRVGLGHTPQPQANGLLGTPRGNARQLRTFDGAVLQATQLAFADLYHGYADSWRVRANQSLFTEHSTIVAGIPSKPFFASHLAPQVAARARATCTAAGVKAGPQLDDCILDNAVLNDAAASKVFVHAVPARLVIKPVLLRQPILREAPTHPTP